MSALTFLLNFVFFHSFGMYSDDWVYFGHVFVAPNTVSGVIHGMVPYADGRPIQWISEAVIGWILASTHSLSACYIFTFAMMDLGLVCMYAMLVHRFTPFFSLLATALFSLSPLYSIKPFLNGETAFALAFTFLFAAGILYVRGHRLLAYVSGALVLLTYESIFPVFAFIPILLTPLANRRDLKRFIVHLFTCAVLIALFVAFKDRYGTRSASQLVSNAGVYKTFTGVALTDLRYSVKGLFGLVNLRLWLHKIRYPDAKLWTLITAVASFCFLQSVVRKRSESLLFRSGSSIKVTEVLIVSTGCILAGYSLVYFGIGGNLAAAVLPFLDRSSRFHIPASFGASVLTAALLVLTLEKMRSTRTGRMISVSVVAAYIALLGGFSVSHQIEFALAAERQQTLVQELIALHPRMDADDTFLIYRVPPAERDTLAIGEEPHTYYFLLQYMFAWPGPVWPTPGAVIRIAGVPDWPRYVTIDGNGNVSWTVTLFPATPEKAGHIWYYEERSNGTLVAHQQPVVINHRNILHNPDDKGAVALADLPREPFFRNVTIPSAAVPVRVQ